MTKAPYKVSIPLRFRDADSEGILFFGRANELAHDAYEDFVTSALGFQWKEWFDHPEWGVPIRHAACDFRRPMRPGDTVEVSVSIKEIGDSSFTSAYVFRNSKGDVHCEVTLTHVFVTRAGHTKLGIPSNVRERLESYRS
jgi:acyl-CoA thioesterase FadM